MYPLLCLFQTLRCNCDMLKLIQLGLSFTDEKGNFAEGCSCWQFNFKFSLESDMFAQDSIDLLKTSGIDFQKFATCGIDVEKFGELMMMSGLILSDDVKWISFHSGYDFGYLLKTLSCEELPSEESAFLEQLYTYFPCIFDIKVYYLIMNWVLLCLLGRIDCTDVDPPNHRVVDYFHLSL